MQNIIRSALVEGFCLDPLKKFAATTATTLKALTLPTATAVTAGLTYGGYDPATISSSLSAFTMSYAYAEFIETLIKENMWSYLSTGQKVALIAAHVAALGGAAYSLANFGVESHILDAGLAAAGSVLASNIGSNLMTLFSKRLRDEDNLFEPNSVKRLVNGYGV